MFKKITKKHSRTESNPNLLKQIYKNIACIMSAEDVSSPLEQQEVPISEVDRDSISSCISSYSQALDNLEQVVYSGSESEDSIEPEEEEPVYIPFEPELKNGCSQYNLILDLDGTLVHTLPCDYGAIFGEADFEDDTLDFYTFKRPGVDKFIKYCFAHFASVSVWTAGTHDYANYVVKNITPKGKQFLYILSRDNCSYHPVKQNTLVKDLHDIWDSYYGRELNITKENTLIVDDNEEVCYHNPDNSLIVSTWGINTRGDNDDFLHKLMFYLDRVECENSKKLCSWLAQKAL